MCKHVCVGVSCVTACSSPVFQVSSGFAVKNVSSLKLLLGWF